MDRLEMIYKRMMKLRAAGVKMKDIARATGFPPSVLSSVYSSVLPAYSALLAEGTAPDEALDTALRDVTNVSKRRLIGYIGDLNAGISALESMLEKPSDASSSPLAEMASAAGRYLHESQAYAGLYICYSSSADRGCMKAEPYMITRAADVDTVQRAYSRTVGGNNVEGICIFSPYQTGYMLFNERRNTQFALRTVCLRLPVMSFPHYIKGICLAHDYNCNPIARRIILVRKGDEIPLDEFSRLDARLIAESELIGDLKAYYDYTCRQGDVIRSMVITSPVKGVEDLSREKDILDRM